MIREHERFTCEVPATVHIDDSCEIAFAQGASSDIPVTIVDCSLGGVGLQTDEVFLPKLARLHLQSCFGDVASTFAVDVRVRRVVMIDRHPRYYIGTSFESRDGDVREQVTAFINWIRQSQQGGTGRENDGA